MKTISFKNPVKINCNVYGILPGTGEGIHANYGWQLCEVDAVLFEQNYFNGHTFYVAKIQGGFRLLEYSTGITIGGSYPDKTANKAAAWFKDRLDQYGTAKILSSIQTTLNAHGRANGSDKIFVLTHTALSPVRIAYSNLNNVKDIHPGEVTDLDTIPLEYTYYLENGLTAKRIN
jgi:hypothetical protein